MISIQKNESFPRWIQIFAFGALVGEVNGRTTALRIGKRLARKNKLDYVYFLNNIVKV